MSNKKLIEILEMLAVDMKKDAENLDGKPFTGKVVAEQFGYQGAAIAALANAIILILLDKKESSNESSDKR